MLNNLGLFIILNNGNVKTEEKLKSDLKYFFRENDPSAK